MSDTDSTRDVTIIAHYMTWYQTPDLSGSWGFWQINRPNIDPKYWHYPDRRKAGGWRDISSVYYPVIGPYDSADPDLCEYHILQAKMAGIDAFICDWYGTEASPEHPYDNIGFEAILRQAEKMNFRAALCIEDRGFFLGAATRDDAVRRGQEQMKEVARTYFASPGYLRLDGRPVIMNFAWGEPGPSVQEFWFYPEEWDRILSVCPERPVFVHDYHSYHKTFYFEAYDSLAPWGSVMHGRPDAPEFWERALPHFGKGRFRFLSATVSAGFDNRGSAGWGDSIVVHDRKDGAIYRAQWESAIRRGATFLQIATWNDLNEGATIEPVEEIVLHDEFPAHGYGYRELEATQDYARRMKNVPFSKEDLRLPERIYELRKSLSEHPEKENLKAQIDTAVSRLLAGDVAGASAALSDRFE